METSQPGDTGPSPDASLTLGDRLADRIAAFGGSWAFIGLSVAVLGAWVVINAWILAPPHHAFDPYPFVFLNLLLSMLAALQAPVIMMSQNRQTERDRRAALRDFEVNTRTEQALAAMRDKLDEIRDTQWTELISLQREQMRLLERLAALSSASRSNG